MVLLYHVQIEKLADHELINKIIILYAVKCNLTELTTRSTSFTFAVSGLLDVRMCQASSCSWSIGRCSSFVGVLHVVSVF